MGGDITLSIFLGFVGFIFAFTNIKFYLAILSILIVFSILNYWIKINIKEFLKSYFLIYFIVFLTIIALIFYFSYDIDTYREFILLDSIEVEKLLPQEYIVYNCFEFLTCVAMIFFLSTFIILPCLLQAYFFKCYSVKEKRKKISWLIGLICNIIILITSMYLMYIFI